MNKDKLYYWLIKDKIPITKSIIAINIILTIITPLLHLDIITNLLAYRSDIATLHPWTAFTYPLISDFNPLSVLFGCLWMWMAGGSLERSWGSKRYLGYFLVVSGITALSLHLGWLITHISLSLIGLWMPLACITVSFAMINPEEYVNIWGIIPLKLKYLALIDVIIVGVSFGSSNLLLGVLALISLFYAYSVSSSKRSWLPSSSKQRKNNAKIVHIYKHNNIKKSLNPLSYFKKKKDEKRLEDLFKRSGFKD